MLIRLANAPEFLNPSGWIDGEIKQIGGVTVVEKLDGRVVSVQPNGDVHDRPAGTAGPWEACSVDPTVNVLRFTGTGIPYALAYRGR